MTNQKKSLLRLLRQVHRAAKYGKKWTPVHDRALVIATWREYNLGLLGAGTWP